MIEQHHQQNQTQLILTPNRSMSWETNKKILLAIFILNMTVALAWAYMGAWLVLPFAGLEVFLVGVGMYYVSWKLSFKQVITVEQESLILQKGVYFPKQEWRWPRNEVTLVKVPSNYRMSPPTLYLKYSNECIEIGDFLNRDDKKKLREFITKLNVPMATKSA